MEIIVEVDEVKSEVILDKKPEGIIVETVTGPAGKPGSEILFGDGVPNVSLGVNNDVYVDELTSDVYKKIVGVWVLQTNFTATSLKIANNLSDLSSVPTARTNLGLGTAAVQNTSAFDPAGAAAAVQGNLDSHEADFANPHAVTKSQIGLGNVDNTSDATKNAATVTLTNKTLTTPVINSPTGLVKADVGLGNVDNTSDVNKPVSTAQQAAIDLRLLKTANLSDLSSVTIARSNLQVGKWTSGSATTMYATAGQDGDFFFNETYKHTFNWINNRWVPYGFPDPRYGGMKFDDFDCNTVAGQLGWIPTGIFFVIPGEPSDPGMFQIRTSAALSKSSIQLRSDSIRLGTADMFFEKLIRLPNLSSAAQEYTATFGLNDNSAYDANGNAVDGVYFCYNRLVNGDFWTLKTASNSVITTTVTATAVVASTLYRLGVLIKDGTSAEFFINGVSVGSHTTNIPTGLGRETGFQYKMDRIAGTANRNIDMGYFWHWYFFNGARA